MVGTQEIAPLKAGIYFLLTGKLKLLYSLFSTSAEGLGFVWFCLLFLLIYTVLKNMLGDFNLGGHHYSATHSQGM